MVLRVVSRWCRSAPLNAQSSFRRQDTVASNRAADTESGIHQMKTEQLNMDNCCYPRYGPTASA
jgi:hypothetical protein